MNRIHDWLGQLSFAVTELSMLVSDERHGFRALGQIGSGRHAAIIHRNREPGTVNPNRAHRTGT